MPGYSKGKIYHVLNSVNSEVYVGSTCQPLSKIMWGHRYYCNKQDQTFYKFMRDIGRDNFYIELIETYPCSTKEELLAREGYYIRERGTLNVVVAGRSKT